MSELRKPQADVGVRQAINEIPDEDLFVSVISIGEIAKGIAAGDLVVTEGTQRLGPGSAVNVMQKPAAAIPDKKG